MEKLRTVVIGLGERGKIHLYGLLQNKEYFEVAGVCDLNQKRVCETAETYMLKKEQLYYDAEKMLNELRPDVMVFATLPHIRLSMAELAVKYHVKGMMFEKPMATSLQEAKKITDLCKEHQIKAVVCQQHKYLRSFQQLRRRIDSGELGEIYQIQASCQPQASQLGTHYIDYMLWANGGVKAKAVTGHVHGNFYLDDSHPSPDYILGHIAFENGVRGILECGYFAKQHDAHETGFSHVIMEDKYWTDDRLTVYGTKGYAYAECSGRYGAFTSDTHSMVEAGDYDDFFKKEQFDAQTGYTREFGVWMLNDKKVHPCNVEMAYHGYEILEGIYMSAIERTRTDLPVPLPLKYDAVSILKEKLNAVDYMKF